MRVVIQRVLSGRVEVAGEAVGSVGRGLVLFVGLEKGDTDRELAWMAKKIAGLRVFEDAQEKMNLALGDIAGAGVLAVPNFTVAGSCAKGRRPSFDGAMPPDAARTAFDRFVELLRGEGPTVETGLFGADMRVHVENDGPITLVVGSPDASA